MSTILPMTNTDTSLIQAVGDSMRAETLPHAPPTHVVQSHEWTLPVRKHAYVSPYLGTRISHILCIVLKASRKFTSALTYKMWDVMHSSNFHVPESCSNGNQQQFQMTHSFIASLLTNYLATYFSIGFGLISNLNIRTPNGTKMHTIPEKIKLRSKYM